MVQVSHTIRITVQLFPCEKRLLYSASPQEFCCGQQQQQEFVFAQGHRWQCLVFFVPLSQLSYSRDNVFLSLSLLASCIVLCNWSFFSMEIMKVVMYECEMLVYSLQSAISISWLTIWLLLGRLCAVLYNWSFSHVNNTLWEVKQSGLLVDTAWRQICLYLLMWYCSYLVCFFAFFFLYELFKLLVIVSFLSSVLWGFTVPQFIVFFSVGLKSLSVPCS